jgi:hypothetical protein
MTRSPNTLPIRLSKVDSLILANQDHYYLDADDQCYFIGEYTARRGFKFSETNNLIYNLKKSPAFRSTNQWYWKERAITQAGATLRAVLGTPANEGWLRQTVLVPIPPSKIPGDPLYDDRILRVLHELGRGLPLDIRELVLQRENMLAAHERDDRPSPDEIAENYYINDERREPAPRSFGIFDDLLTTGSHFKAMQTTLRRQFPDIPITGIFVARRVPETDDPVEGKAAE